MCFSVLSGCSLVARDESYKDSEVVMTVNNTQITREELINQYYSFYNQYNQYFVYYDSDTMIDWFYNSVITRALVLEKANEALDDETIKFVDDEYDKIWYDVFDYINAQINTREKAILIQSGIEEDNLPERLKSDTSSETAYKYEPYEFEEVEFIDYSTKVSAIEPEFEDKMNELLTTAIFTYNAEKDADKPRIDTAIADEERAVRSLAFDRYVEGLVLTAKADKKDATPSKVVEREVERLYKSYYESALQQKYQEYIESTVVDTLDTHENLLSDEIIAKKYIELVNKDNQTNSTKENYVDVITSSSTESLILYHYNGENTYFTVQHILIKFDDATVEELKMHEGYDVAVDSLYRDEYIQYRASLAGPTADMTTPYRDDEGYYEKETINVGGEEKEVNKTITVAEILSNYQDDIAAIAGGATLRDKTLLFNQYAWKYSADTGSLNTKFATKLGMTISSEVDSHGNFVVDFANGGRELYENYVGGTEIGDEISLVLSDYGLHLMMLTGVYEPGKLVATTEAGAYRSYADIVNDLKNTYVSNLTEQSLYQYFYDMVKDELVGSSGKYYSNYRSQLVKDCKENGDLDDSGQLSYSELSAAIGV